MSVLNHLRSAVLKYRLYRFMPTAWVARLMFTKPTAQDIEEAKRFIAENT